MTARGWSALAVAALLVAIACFATWKVQDWRYSAQLADQAEAYQCEREAGALAVIDWQEVERGKRQALEDRLRANDQIHYKELTNAQNDQARLRDRLATSDLRLSVLLAAPAPGIACGVPATPGPGGVVHGAARGELDPAAAQRIVAITDAGDQGLTALQACQAYVRLITQ
ncbi:lysis system i-spanin subunit Rz [Pseudomonas vranovensis]|uniref:lysis system i-spanin subunit Rz n=1 Tax=Pseudomonas vranovensis TaxID=321661 RepID=UPI00048F61C5|nr:lysis system i-spanin subunit Rz [Pseudomonas vranovensis]